MNTDQLTKTCNHATNGSLRAFVDGFQAVTSREPEEFIDYRFCCSTLDKFNAETLNEEQLGECRAIGEQHGRRALEDGPKWKTVKLRSDEVEQLVRWHLNAHVDSWIEAHDGEVYGGCYSGSTSRRRGYANGRLDYLYFKGGVGLRMDEIERELFREHIGEPVKKCDCNRCLDARNRLFPETTQEWKQKAEEPQWQAFTAEVRQQFPAIPDNDLSLLTQRMIQGGEAAEPSTEGARRAVELHARWQSDYKSHLVYDHSEEEAMRGAKPVIEALLAKWSRGAEKPGADLPPSDT